MTRTILITGASSGLGEEMARQFAARGYDLALCARRLDRLEELRADVLAAHPERRVEVRTLDVTDDDAVFTTFRALHEELGRIDRIVVNAGIGKGAPLGTGRHDANRETAMTNFVAALAQAEAAMEVFRTQGTGHLVLVSSMAALRGLPKAQTTYAATKAALSSLGEGLRAELYGKPIKVTVLHPGYIVSGMNDVTEEERPRLMARTDDGVRAMVEAIEKEKPSAYVPGWPWAPLSVVMKHAPVPVFRRLV
ncbi:SDR family oxidoreductase [Nocardioides pyridinolyticus]